MGRGGATQGRTSLTWPLELPPSRAARVSSRSCSGTSVAVPRDVPGRQAIAIVTAALFAGCVGASGDESPADLGCEGKCDGASSASVAALLLGNLHAQMDTGVTLFGQERFNVTGVKRDGTQWLATAGDVDRSDAKTVLGAHPVVMGFDAWDLAIKPQSWSPSGAVHAEAARHVHANGGIVEMAFHMHGCAVGSFNAPGNEGCLCRAANDDAFARTWLLAEYAKVADAIVTHGLDRIPIVFRPLHEHDGGWFWWGAPHWNCSGSPRYTGAAAYQRVFRTIVTYLRETRGLRNLLIAYSPVAAADDASYLHGYPGDAYVDILGADFYYQATPSFAEQSAMFREQLARITRIARTHGKVAALTEVGNTQLSSEPTHRWYTDHLLPLLTAPGVDVAYAMTWENRTSGAQQFWLPYEGHAGAADARAFADHAATALLEDAPAFDAAPATFPVCNTCTSDPDGDRWGWESDQSCRVASWCVAPEVPSCVRCASDPDGDGWGWENARSCVVLASCR